MINLEEHKFFEFEKKIEVVPYDIALKAIDEVKAEAADKIGKNLNAAMKLVSDSMTQINNSVKESINTDD
jgi:hypothetical protein